MATRRQSLEISRQSKYFEQVRFADKTSIIEDARIERTKTWTKFFFWWRPFLSDRSLYVVIYMIQTFRCKWCGTRYCKECLRGDFIGLMINSSTCRKCSQGKCQGARVEYVALPEMKEEQMSRASGKKKKTKEVAAKQKKAKKKSKPKRKTKK